jgi:hypothetical protein
MADMLADRNAKLRLDEVKKLVPTRAPAVETRRNGDETEITVRRSNTRLARILSWFFVLPLSKKFTLDRLGSLVWDLCDGKRNVEEVIRRFGDAEKLERERSEPAVLQFLTMLSGRRLVSFMPAGMGGSPPLGGGNRPDGIE